MIFEGKLVGAAVAGTVRQGAVHGTFRLRRGEARALVAPGLYEEGTRQLSLVDDPYGPARLVDLDSGRVNALFPSGEGFSMFLVVFSGPAVTANENDLYQDLTGQGERPQQLSNRQIDAQVLSRGRGGIDPMPWIRNLRIPVLWLYGGRDEHIPARLSVRRLEPLVRKPGRDFSVDVFPDANHALVETRTGLTSEMLRSDRFAPELFAAVAAWLRRHGLS
jgi:pimeloyl-ACP methyl ester carboxylesterase